MGPWIGVAACETLKDITKEGSTGIVCSRAKDKHIYHML